MKQIKLLGNRLLLQQLPPDKLEGPFILSPKYTPEQRLHRVLQVGPKVTTPLAPGQVVLLDQYTLQSRTQVDDSNLWIVNADDCCLAYDYERRPLPAGYSPV
jgi:hypothetical protein